MKRIAGFIFWLIVGVAGGWAFLDLTTHRGDSINSGHILLAALCSYAIGYRFYSKWIAARVLTLDDRRATPCEVKDDGRDFVKTNRWIVFGHHFAAISGPGPLVGPVLAAQFGYLPGTLWILIGVVLGGAVQDFVVLFASLRRHGKSLGQMVKEEMNSLAGVVAMIAILAILVILLAVLALVVVNALAESPWGVFTVGATIPIALIVGVYLRFGRVGRVLEATAIGVVLLLLAVWGGRYAHNHETLAAALSLKAETLAWSVIIYALAASVLPIWLLLAPRDYLSTFMKLGTIFALVVGVGLLLPQLKMPAVSRFIDGSGPVVPGKLFPFCFITIACGAISGFHTLISSGTTPKIITREGYSRPIGYGAMCLESLVAIVAIIAACSMDPGVYLSMNMKGAPDATVAKVAAWGFPVTVDQMSQLAQQTGEKTLFSRAGGAATLAVGMAQIFSSVTHGRGIALWYHFAIMFEALFILTTLDAGTRVGRYLLQDALGGIWKPLADTRKLSGNLIASALMVAAWGWFLVQGVRDPLGGINSLWPLFGISNQLLAAVALCLVTTVILKMQLSPSPTSNQNAVQATPSRPRPVYALVTLVPLVWLLTVTMTAGYQKIFDVQTRPDFPRVGFLQIARELDDKAPGLTKAVNQAQALGDTKAIEAAEKAWQENRRQHFNNVLDAAVAGFFMMLVAAIAMLSVVEWWLLLSRRRVAKLHESEPVWLPGYAVAESRPAQMAGVVALSLALAKELSGEAQMDRAEQQAAVHQCHKEECGGSLPANSRERNYLEMTEKRFNGINRCC